MHMACFPNRNWGMILQQAWSLRLRDRIYTHGNGNNYFGHGNNFAILAILQLQLDPDPRCPNHAGGSIEVNAILETIVGTITGVPTVSNSDTELVHCRKAGADRDRNQKSGIQG